VRDYREVAIAMSWSIFAMALVNNETFMRQVT
jgi:hypothetical protein